MANLPELLTPREAAAVRRTTVGHLANERYRGLGPPFVRDGGKILYPAEQLRDYISTNTVTPSRRGAYRSASTSTRKETTCLSPILDTPTARLAP